ncbi:MarR family winged helix-turn-helix transcriptional regulator [Frankia sp. AgB32]|uniref:MarR family winged helix-turn-helix transcriptional regulator n=1 Tax=Frankia sp. AgB32 TaxID=631119 RepID=UPI002010175E|nr:MarR family transcriptional regulator [Frankia sp. AgB32]MCK9895286.1 MarR family transcriptional regulator [Frankia sp. AgB32]
MSSEEPDVRQLAAALRLSVGMLVRRLRQSTSAGGLTIPESAALARLDRGGPATSAALARVEQISPQAMGVTLAALESRGLVERRRDPGDGRQVILSPTEAGIAALNSRRDARTELIAGALDAGFTPAELDQLAAAVPLLARLAERI